MFYRKQSLGAPDIVIVGIPQVDHVAIFPHVIWLYRGRTIGKVMGAGGWGRNENKIKRGKMSPKKIHSK